MPKVHEEAGCKFYVNPHDHDPVHVHVVIGDDTVILNLDTDASLRRASRAKMADVIKAQRIPLANRGKLQKAWDNVHGK